MRRWIYNHHHGGMSRECKKSDSRATWSDEEYFDCCNIYKCDRVLLFGEIKETTGEYTLRRHRAWMVLEKKKKKCPNPQFTYKINFNHKNGCFFCPWEPNYIGRLSRKPLYNLCRNLNLLLLFRITRAHQQPGTALQGL